MKLLIVTQKVDKNDPILGFFHRWIEEFATHCEQVIVVTQFAGEYSLPFNVAVLSLGKEKGASKLGQIVRFWRLQWKMRKSYDVVFVHMTPVWVVLGARLWKILKKPTYLWYEARGGGLALPRALSSVRTVFGATEYGLPQKSEKHVIMGHGIDTDQFAMGVWARDPNLVLAVGRITHTKRLDIIIDAFAALPSSSKLIIAGGTITQSDQVEWQKLKKRMEDLHLQDRVEVQWVHRDEMPKLLGRAGLMLHACEGGLDKAVLEAMSCGCPIISCSIAARDVLPIECIALPDAMKQKALGLLALQPAAKQELGNRLRDIVVLDHSLPKLVNNLCITMSKQS